MIKGVMLAALTLVTALLLAACGSATASHHTAATFHPSTETNSTPATASSPVPAASTGLPQGCSVAVSALHWSLRHGSEGLDAVIGHLKHVVTRIPAGPLRTEVAKFGVALGLAAIYTQRGQPRQAAKMEHAARVHAATVKQACAP